MAGSSRKLIDLDLGDLCHGYSENSTADDFSLCIEDSILSWGVCILSMVISLAYVLCADKSHYTFSFYRPGVLTVVSGLATIVPQVVILTLGLNAVVLKTNALVIIISTFVIMIVVLFERTKGNVSILPVWMFWALLTILGGLKIRTLIRVWEEITAINETLPTLFFVYIGLCLFNLIVYSFREIPDQLLSKRRQKDGAAYVRTKDVTELRDPSGDHRMKYDRSAEVARKPCQEELGSFPNCLTYHWLTRLVWKGYKKPLTDGDLYEVPKNVQTQQIMEQFFVEWSGCKPCPDGRSTCKNDRNTFLALARCNIKTILCAIVLKLMNDFLNLAPSLIMKQLIYYNGVKHSGEEDLPLSYGLFFCFMMVGLMILQTFCIQGYFFNATKSGMRIRVALVSAIYRKALLLNSTGQQSSQLGQMINLMQVDAQKFQDMFTYLNMLWSAPLQITLSMYFLYQELGPSTFVGLAVTVVVLPISSVIMGKLHGLQRSIMGITDSRVKKTNEILDGIKVIKLYGWEDSFTKEVDGIRGRELSTLKMKIKFHVLNSFVWTCTPIMVTLLSFLTYALLGNNLTSQKAFVSVALFALLRFPLFMLPNMINQLIQARVSMNRINTFLDLPELDPSTKIVGSAESPTAIEIKDGNFSWEEQKPDSDDEEIITLRGINVAVPRGKLVAVVGPVGSGKSSLVSAVLGELNKRSGTVHLNGKVSYVPQVSWILNDTLQNNILFGAPWDRCWYKKVLHHCALEPDLLILPDGDETEIGEKGINLSGGQKQRVSLARAIYNKSDIYIFDDPLSAVDAHVGKHLFEKVLGPQGIVRDKTRLLVTHKLSVLNEVDHIIVMKDGMVLEQGSYQELMARDSELNRLVSSYEPEQVKEEYVHVAEEAEEPSDLPASPEKADRERHRSSISRKESECSRKCSEECSGKDRAGTGNKPATPADKLIKDEKVEEGRINRTVFLTYIRYMGLILSSVTFGSFLLEVAARLGNNFWLAEWTGANDNSNSTSDKDNADTFMYLGVYSLFNFLQTVFLLSFTTSLFLAGVRASSSIHRNMFSRILRVPMSFFDTTPIGRILNRFSKDMNTIDEAIPNSFRSFLSVVGTVLFTGIIISANIPIMIPILLPILLIYVAFQRIYIPTSRQLKRLESVSRSPVYNQFGETIQGLASIRAYGKSREFIGYNQGLTDDNVRSYYCNIMSNRWLSVRLEMTGHLIVFSTALIAVLQAEKLDAAKAGLAISTALSVTQPLAWLVRMWSEVEVNVVSMERVSEYSELETEAKLTSERPPATKWPDKGKIHYKDVSVRYREGLDLVLKKLNFTITPGERVGIVGRTGAGKSSVTLTLFRILELAEGRIEIDGVDIGGIGLHELRQRLSIIPQDPVLFSSSIRRNLDPFGSFSDEQLWSALEAASLKTFFGSQEAKLDFMIQEGGSNLSVGQRQLVCLARALLTNRKIIVMDEATAAVDIETDSVIQDAIRKTFAGRTILTIAHRLNTILDYDRILVLDKGEIAEFGTVAELRGKNGIFNSMLKDAGLAHE